MHIQDQNGLRWCTACTAWHPAQERVFQRAGGGGLRRVCRVAVARRVAAKGAQQHSRTNAEKRRQYKARLRERRDVLKLERGCVNCGYSRHPAALEFDHLPGSEKSKDIAALISYGKPWSVVLAEIEKCEVVCANCHRERTAARDPRWNQGRQP